ncbi:TetR/AcrR family transcriptional regulator [Micromonospora sp. NPDC050397]|uniref:TetR/AcrR family transcriptional regulator n=1 Tax=Micromonospora sp. NPDC050397 TaxID=3364279 RepID=UPI00384EE4BD
MTDMTTTADAPRSPGRPRSTRVDEAIVEATLDLLAEGSTLEALSIEAIAARAGVGKATIYRRWSGKEALIVDTLRTLKGPPPVPDTGNVRADLVILLSAVGRTPDARAASIFPCMMPMLQRDPAMHRLYQELLEPRRQVMRDVLRRGIERGELRADLDIELTLAMLTAPVLLQRLLRWHPKLDEESLPERVIDALFGGIAAD